MFHVKHNTLYIIPCARIYAHTREREKPNNQQEWWVYKTSHVNRVQMNHVQMNHVQMNRIQMNHVQMNRVHINPFDYSTCVTYSTAKRVPIYEYLFIYLFEATECVLKVGFKMVAIVVHGIAQMPIISI